MYLVLLAHEDPFLRSYITEKLQFMFDVDVVDSGQGLMDRLQSRVYMAAIVGTTFTDVGARDLSTWMRAAGYRRPRQVILIRTEPYFGVPKEMAVFDRAITVSMPSQTQVLINCLAKTSKDLKRESWSGLSPLQKDLIDTHLSICQGLRTQAVEETIGSPAFAKGIDLLVETSQGRGIEHVLESLKDYDDYTFAHQMSVASLLVMFGIEVGIPAKDLRVLAQAGILHDVGKREVPLSILHKPGALTAAEWVVMKDHARHSARILGRIDGLSKHVVNVAGQHHERVDGAGYPYGLKAEAIDELSLVCAVADVFSALTDKRPYKPPKTQREALRIMAGLCGTQIDGGVFRHFKAMIEGSDRYRAESASAAAPAAAAE